MIIWILTYINALGSEAIGRGMPEEQVTSFCSDGFSSDHKYTVLSVYG